MKSLKLVIFFMLFLASNLAEAKKNTRSLPRKSETAEQKPASNWSHFFSFLKPNAATVPKVRFEFGLMTYYAAFKTWNFQRFEPFIKIHYAILDKYIQVYTMFTLDASAMKYRLSHMRIADYDIKMNADLSAIGTPSFGGGLQLFTFGWKKLSVYTYANIQTASSNEATLKGASLSINEAEIDILEPLRPYVNITYDFRRYDVGQYVQYQFLDWLSASLYAGYIWLKANVKINLDQDLADTIMNIASAYDKNLIPNRLELDEQSPFAMLGLNFKVYKRIYIALEATVVPTSHPIYYGSLSMIINGDK